MTLLEELTDLFPDIQQADAVRILLHLGYNPDELHQAPTYKEVFGSRICIPVAYLDGIKEMIAAQKVIEDSKLDILRSKLTTAINDFFERHHELG